MPKHGGWDFFLTKGQTRVGLVLIHEIFGFDDYIKSVANQLSKNGHWVAAVDIYRGKRPTTLEEGFKVRESLSKDEILDALGNGLKLLKEQIGNNARIGTMGFCMGGGFALLGACNLEFDFCIDYYGMTQSVDEVAGLKGPVQLMLGGEDERINPWAFQNFLPAAMKYKKRVDLHFYPNSRHAFHRPGWEGHNPDAAMDAWAKTLLFLRAFDPEESRHYEILG